MKIILSFATEDFVTPEHDEAILRLANLLSSRNIKGNFHLTGDWTRSLRAKRRLDVIESLKKHEIGYHGNTHGAFPFIAEVCENNTWDDAVSILTRTEASGVQDVADLFGVYPKYFVLEFVKAPQLIHAIRCLGIDVLGLTHLPERESPFSWYAGSICFTAPMMGVESPPAPGRLEGFLKEFDTFLGRDGTRNGVMKLFNHPYKFTYNNNVASWVSENDMYRDYSLNKNWKIPTSSMYDRATIDALFDEFERFIDHAASQPGVQFVGTSELADQYRRESPRFVEMRDLFDLAARSSQNLAYIEDDGCFFSPAEVFAMTTYALDAYSRDGAWPDRVPRRSPLGPVEEIPESPRESVSIACERVLDTLPFLDREIDFHRRLPAEIEFGGVNISLGSAYKALTKLLVDSRDDDGAAASDSNVTFEPAPKYPEIADQSHLRDETFTREIYPEGFTGETICAHAKRQAWTYKPAAVRAE